MSPSAELTREDVASENQGRAIVYNFLSSLFAKELNKDLVAQLTSEQGQSFLNSLALEPTLAASIDKMKTKLTKLNSDESLLELAADFCGLFLVDGRTSVSPYAGQYLNTELSGIEHVKKKSEKVQVFGEFHQQMTEFLNHSNVQVHSDFPEPGDHIAVILAYAAHLCLSASIENQLSFIETYLMTWISKFTQQVSKHDHDFFYSAVAELTLKWLEIEVAGLTKDS
jgi:TorA-specific chaperone